MKATDQEQARRLGEYADELVTARGVAGQVSDPPSPEDHELEQLRALVRRLSAARIAPPPGFQEALAARLRQPEDPVAVPAPDSTAEAAPGKWWRPFADWIQVPRVAMTGVTMAVVLLLFSQSLIDHQVLSAQSVLLRSDEALEALAGPGQILYRKWRVQSSGGPGMMTGTAQPGRIIEEWMDGEDSERVAARWYTLDGRLQVAYTTVMSDGEYRPHVYFSPGLYGETRGLLNIEPTMREFGAALAHFPETIALALRLYLDRHYIYAPIRGERHYNRAIFAPSSELSPQLPRVVASFNETQLNGQEVHRVKLVDSASVTFNWRSVGPSVVRIGQAEIVRFVDKNSMLSVRTEERVVFGDGRRRESIRELEATDILRKSDQRSDPFILDVPPGTPARWQSAHEHLSSVADALGALSGSGSHSVGRSRRRRARGMSATPGSCDCTRVTDGWVWVRQAWIRRRTTQRWTTSPPRCVPSLLAAPVAPSRSTPRSWARYRPRSWTLAS